jgi:hypothetical protein
MINMLDANFFKQLFGNLLSITVVGGLVIWLIKAIITKFFQNDSEKYKTRLQSELEIHKTKLQLEQFKYTKLHSEQCEFIKTLFQKLTLIDILLEDYLKIVKSDRSLEKRDKKDVLEPLVKETFDTDKYFRGNKILINKDLSDKIETTIQMIFESLKKISLAFVVKSKNVYSSSGEIIGIEARKLSEINSEDKAEFDDIIDNVENVRQIVLKDSLTQLELNFRQIFGIEKNWL